jgi:hypothetical protein
MEKSKSEVWNEKKKAEEKAARIEREIELGDKE